MKPKIVATQTASLPAKMAKIFMIALQFDNKDFHLSSRLKAAIDAEIATGNYQDISHNKAVIKAGCCLAHKDPGCFDLLNKSDQTVLDFARLATRPNGDQITPEEMMRDETENPSGEPMTKLTLSLLKNPNKKGK